ncbi:MAG TPA: ABC transporter permease, partial [Gaiellaceae bacterium]|nr:ABC transporter permease [Gaiellaceae bacterium]
MSIAQLEAREVAMEAPSGLWREAWYRLRRNPGAIVGFSLVMLFVLLAIFAPLIAPFDPRAQNLSLLQGGCCPGPSGEHYFGVDDLGRDEFSRVVYGARFSLLIGIVSVAVGLSFGLVLGAIAGYVGGIVDSIVMRLMDIMLSIPGLLLAIGIVAALGQGLIQIMVAVGATQIPIFARLLR